MSQPSPSKRIPRTRVPPSDAAALTLNRHFQFAPRFLILRPVRHQERHPWAEHLRYALDSFPSASDPAKSSGRDILVCAKLTERLHRTYLHAFLLSLELMEPTQLFPLLHTDARREGDDMENNYNGADVWTAVDLCPSQSTA